MRKEKSPFRWKSLSCPTKEISELIVASTKKEQQELTEQVKKAMEECYRKNEMLLTGCAFRGFRFILAADPKLGPALITFEDFTRSINEAKSAP